MINNREGPRDSYFSSALLFHSVSLFVMHLSWTRTCFALAMVFILGCGSGRHPKSVWVHGKVVGRNGKSIGQAVLILWPENSKINSGAGALCEDDGTFTVQCLPGNYKVTVSLVRPKGATAPPPHQSESGIPDRYQNELTTTLTLKVPETGAENIVLNLK